MNSCSIIINPTAGHGRAGRLARRLLRIVRTSGIPAEILRTTGPGDATRLARLAQGETVIAVGGDGTLNEVANGLQEGRALGIVPAGSGNDLIKSLPIPRDPVSAMYVALGGRVERIDAGRIEAVTEQDGAQRGSERLFLNGVGVGFDAAVAVRKERIPFLRGTPQYAIAVLQTLRHFEAPFFHYDLDSVSGNSHRLLIAIGNGKCAGGGFYLTPDASIDDGLFDVCAIEAVRIKTVLKLMPRVMHATHMHLPIVRMLRTASLVLRSESAFPVHADGEIIGTAVRELKITVLPKYLPICVP